MLRTAVQGDRSLVRLSQIKTNWSQLFAANQPTNESAAELQKELLLDYSGAVFRYLQGAVRDEDVACELAQEFAVRFLRGDFRNVVPEKGRFRDFLKRTLSNLANDYFRSQKSEQNRRQKAAQTEIQLEGTAPSDSFEEDWVIEVLRRAWDALEQEQLKQGGNYFTVLRARAESPALNSHELCESLCKAMPEYPWNEVSLRQSLSRARKQFAQLLRSEVAKTLKVDRYELVEEELAALGLLKFCQ